MNKRKLKRELKDVLGRAGMLYHKLTIVCQQQDCLDGDKCPFHDRICLDIDNVIANIERVLER
jgi:hypothetical protein